MLYYCQRLPGELGRFHWVIDAKSELNITPQEDWWRKCVKPMLQSRSMREPLAALKGGDYSAYRRNFPSKGIPTYLKDHLRKGTPTNDLTAVLREMEFADSRQHVGLQIADALTNCVRRSLIGNLQADGWRHLGKLMIRQGEGSVKFISMGSGGLVRERPYGSAAKQLAEGQRSMLTEGREGPRRARGSRRASR
jgi:hypothetical protein